MREGAQRGRTGLAILLPEVLSDCSYKRQLGKCEVFRALEGVLRALDLNRPEVRCRERKLTTLR